MNVTIILNLLREKGLVAGKRFSKACTQRQDVPKHNGVYCRDCEAYHEMCVVEDYIWEQIHTPQSSKIVLCFDCMERRLKRKITLEDLKKVPCNAPYFIGFQMERF